MFKFIADLPGLAASALALFLCACAPTLSELRADLPESAGGFDAASLDGDRTGQIAAAGRLCHPLANAVQRSLGFELARRAHVSVPSDPETALLLARCAYLRSEREQDAAMLAQVTAIGVEAASIAGSSRARQCLGHSAKKDGATALCPREVSRAAYWHALLIGLLMRVAGMREALSLLEEEMALLDVARLTAEEEEGGPLRVLAMIYLKAPSWPAGPGDLDQALELLQEAVRRFPSHPLNRIFLAAALAEDGQDDAAKEELARGLTLADEALWGEVARDWRDLDALLGQH